MTEGKSSNHAIFSKTVYTRNVSGMPFPRRLGEKALDSITKKIDGILQKNGFRCESISENDALYPLTLAEKGFVGKEFLFSDCKKSIYFNEPCSLSVALGGKDLISISSLLGGLAVPDTRNIASGAEELLDKELEFAYDEHVGYYSSSPALCGSGTLFSVLLFLPAARLMGEISQIRSKCAEFGAAFIPAFTYPDNCGDIYQVSFSPSHFADEISAAEGFSALAQGIIAREIALERIIFEENAKIIADGAWRAYAQLLYARRLDERDLISLSSSIRFAFCASEGNGKLPPITVKDLNYMLAEGLNASVAHTKQSCASEEECADIRAEIISKLVYTASGN